MDKYEKRIERLLKQNGATLKRRKKHIVYELANGNMVVRSSTPSDTNASKAIYSDVKRAARHSISNDAPHAPSITDVVSTEKKARFRPPVRDHVSNYDPGVFIQPLRDVGLQPSHSPGNTPQFTSVAELISVADEADSFWVLNPDGRARVLMKLAENFAKIEVIGTRSVKTSFRGIMWYMARTPRRDPLMALWGFEWHMPITRSLLIRTDDSEPVIVDTASKGVIFGTPQISLIYVKSGFDLDERAEIETIDADPVPELRTYVFHHFIHTSKMPARRLSLPSSEEWVNPQATKRVIADLLSTLAGRRKA